jgi:tetratricopeptide (TPR) repeat protein
MMFDWYEQEGIRLWVFGRYGAAEEYLQRTVRSKPDDEMARYRLGVCLYYLNRFSEAEAHLRRAVDLKPEDENNQHMLGNCLYKLDRFSEALPYLQRAVDLKPHDKKFQEKLRDCQSSISPVRKVMGIFERNRPRLEQSDSEVEERIKLGNLLFDSNQYAEAIPHLKLGVSRKPDVAASHWRLGLSLFRLEQYHDAEVHLQRAVELKPTFTVYRHYLGTCLYNRGKYREAEPFLQRRVELNPDDEASRHMFGWTLYNLNRFSEAEIHIKHLVDLKPDNENLRYMLGACLCKMEKYKEAEPHLQRAVDLKPNDDRGTDSTNRDWLNKCQSNLSHRVTVADIFEEAIARNSGDSVAFGDLGVMRLYQDRFAEALALFREALRLSPADFYKVQIVECYERLGNLELAQQMRLEYPDLFEVNTPEPDQELLKPPTFSEFLASGSTWLDGAGWENRQLSLLLKSLHQQNAKWADPTKVLFPEYDIEEDDLAETLARAESLQQHLHLETEMPVYLRTDWVSVAMTIENDWIRAWVGIGLDGCAVSLNPNTWDLQFLNGDRDALFAAAVVVNWYIDCSIMLTAHPKFLKDSADNRDEIRPWHLSDNGWSATSLFTDDVDDIREGRQSAPPRAHRVRGHKRSLTQREPSDDARAKAPAHIRAFMGPNDTWVQAHARGGQTETQNLLTRLHKHSSLADFLATAQLDFD